MELYINNEKVPYELEKEKNSYEVIDSIGEYAAQSEPKQFITFIKINDKEFSYADEDGLKKIAIDTIDKLFIETSDIHGITSLSMEQIERFLGVIENIFTGEKIDESMLKIIDSIDWMKEGVNQIVEIYSDKENYLKSNKLIFFENCEKIKELIGSIKNVGLDLTEEKKNNSLAIFKVMKESFLNIKLWLISSFKMLDRDSILNNINKIISDIDSIIPNLGNVPILFQTGEDDEAMKIIQNLADILERCIGLFVLFKETFKLHMDKFTVREVSFEEFFKTITVHLKDLMDAIQVNDSVMISDLLEYEFIPNIEEVKNIIERIKEEAFLKAN